MKHKSLDLITPQEAASLLRVHREQVYKMIREGGLPAAKVGTRAWRIDKDELMRWLDARKN